MDNRIGDWIETYTGKKFWALDPHIDEICIEDIAHALSQTCRYNGHCKFFYSVAQHSINIAKELAKQGYDIKIQLYGLLHDGSEAYICDIPHPVKMFMPEYRKIEEKLQNTIYQAFGLNIPTEQEYKPVRAMDTIMLFHEVHTLMNNIDRWAKDVDINTVIEYRNSKDVEKEFITLTSKLIKN